MKEIEALQNAGNNVGLVIHEKFQEDKRRTVNKYFATLDGISISPVLDYENLNYFILGYIKASTIINKQIHFRVNKNQLLDKSKRIFHH